MINKYDYLSSNNPNKDEYVSGGNLFLEVQARNIEEAEKALDISFPNSLKKFWTEIGYGFLNVDWQGKERKECVNRILPPEDIASIVLDKEDSGLVIPEFIEYLDSSPDDMPFFEIADSASFLVMRPLSNNPDVIYDMLGNKIADNMGEFIHRLYYEAPDFYLHIADKKQA